MPFVRALLARWREPSLFVRRMSDAPPELRADHRAGPMTDTGSMLRAAMEIFAAVVEHGPAERSALLDELCKNDPPPHRLRTEVERMLARDAQASPGVFVTGAGLVGGSLDPSFIPHSDGATATTENLAGLPAIAGHYRIIRQLGEGGMGVVYLAEQSVPRRLVALKAVHGGVGRNILDRFTREAHILGRLQHPGIAQIYEAGVAGDDHSGRAYIVIEYVDGPTITEYAERERLDRHARLGLFFRVCDAVHHAHLRRVIHRDLKPPNILVDSAGQPKVLDFGIARLESDDPHSQRLDVTRDDRALLGTPAYMSPEQLAGGEVDARADVYALGVVLFQLLTGRLPHDLSGKSVAQVMHIVRTEAPRRATQLDSSLAGDLDAIILTALNADPLLRYQSADALASDIRRHLAGEPIAARTEPLGRTLLRVTKRHRAIVALGAALAVTLIAATAGSLVMADRNARLAQDASAAKTQTETVAASLREALYVSRVGHAQAAIAAGDVSRAAAELAACPPDQRGWEWRHLILATDQSERRFDAAASGPMLRLMPDGNTLVVAHSERPIQLLDATTGAALGSFGETGRLSACRLSPDGRWLALRRLDGIAELHDISARSSLDQVTPPPMERPPLGGRGFSHVDWSIGSEGSGELLGIRADGRCFVWSLQSKSFVRDFLVNAAPAYDLRTTRDGTIGITSHSDLAVRVFRVSDGSTVAVLDKIGQTPLSLAISPVAPIVAIALFDGRILLWNWENPSSTTTAAGAPYRTLEAHASRVLAMEFSPDGTTLASGGEDRALRTWDVQSGVLAATQQGESSRIRSLTFASDSSCVFVAGESKSVRVFRTRPEALVPTAALRDFPIFSCSILQSDEQAIFTTRSGYIGKVDLATGAPSYMAGATDGLRSAVQPPSNELVLAVDGGRVVFANGRTGRSISSLDDLPKASTLMSASPDGAHIVAWQHPGTLASIDWKTRSISHRWSSPGRNYKVAVGPGGQIAAGDDLPIVRVFDERGTALGPDIKLKGHATALAFSTGGSLLAVATEPSTIGLWNWRDGSLVHEFKGSWASVSSLAFFDGDTRLAGGSSDHTVHIWRLPAGEEVLTLGGHRGAVVHIAVTSDGQSLVTADGMGIVRVWKTDALARASQPGSR